MTRTFLVAINLPDDVDPSVIADDIQYLLEEELEVTSVKPWSSPLQNEPFSTPSPFGIQPDL